MAALEHQELHLSMRSCRYTLPDDLRFVTLVRAADKGTIKIRFSRPRDTTLDLPVSAETLADLIHAMGHMYGTPPNEIPQVIENYRQQGGPVIVE
jgi:hypothetical protein